MHFGDPLIVHILWHLGQIRPISGPQGLAMTVCLGGACLSQRRDPTCEHVASEALAMRTAALLAMRCCVVAPIR